MQYIAPTNWTNLDETRGLLFFAQRVAELTFPYTLDSYKSPALSLPGLLKEAIQILERDWAEESKQKQVQHLLSEIRSRCRANSFIEDILHMPLAEYFRLDTNDIDSTTINLKSFLAEINEEAYLASIADHIISLAAASKSKKLLDLLAVEFVSTLQYLGVSRDYIYQSTIKTFFESAPVDDARVIFAFIRDIYPHSHKFTVYCIATESIRLFGERSLSSFGIEALESLPKGISSGSFKKFVKLSKTPGFAVFAVSIAAIDYNSAATMAKGAVDRLASVYQLFHHKWTYDLLPVAVAQQMCCSNVFKEALMHGNAMHYIKDQLPDRARASLSDVLSNRAFVSGPDRSKYMNLIEMHGLSARTLSPESQLINVWTCLETISPPSGSPGSNIDRVASNIVPVLALRHLKQILVSLLFDLFRWDRKKVLKAFKLFGPFKSGKAHMRLFELISTKDNQKGLEYLLAELGDFELLRFRLFSVSDMFASKKSVKEAINAYEARVRWQIHRIYRTRNSIVHSGVSPKYSKYLVESAHDYFDQCFDFCLSLSAHAGKFNTFSVCFGFASRQYEYYLKSLDEDTYLDRCIWDLKVTKGKKYIFGSQ